MLLRAEELRLRGGDGADGHPRKLARCSSNLRQHPERNRKAGQESLSTVFRQPSAGQRTIVRHVSRSGLACYLSVGAGWDLSVSPLQQVVWCPQGRHYMVGPMMVSSKQLAILDMDRHVSSRVGKQQPLFSPYAYVYQCALGDVNEVLA